MIKFDVKNRCTGEVQFTAEIECEEGAALSVKLGLAVMWAVEYGANLVRASLDGADLDGANLYGADLYGVSGINDWIKCIQVDEYPVAYTSEVLQIGCERHDLKDWLKFDDARIAEMDGKRALKFWRKWKGWIFQTIEMAPAKPTGSAG